jgi:hypothetical protein
MKLHEHEEIEFTEVTRYTTFVMTPTKNLRDKIESHVSAEHLNEMNARRPRPPTVSLFC